MSLDTKSKGEIMYGKDFFDRILNAECTPEELIDYSDNYTVEALDSFSIFYKLDTVLNCFMKYREGRISGKHLADWGFVYAHIITGSAFGKRTESQEEIKTVDSKKLIEDRILKILCAKLEDFANKCEKSELDTLESLLKSYDKIYNTLKDWTLYFSFEGDENNGFSKTGDVTVVLLNTKAKEFAVDVIYDAVFDRIKIEGEELSKKDLYKNTEDWQAQGYAELVIKQTD